MKHEISVTAHPIVSCASRIIGLLQGRVMDLSARLGEGSLAEQLDVSRATVRAALEHLEVSGLVRRVPRAGTYLNILGPEEFCQVMDIRAALEMLAARLAATRLLPVEADELLREAEKVDALNGRLIGGEREVLPELSSADTEFHLRIARLSGNPYLVTTLAQQRLLEQSYTVAWNSRILHPRNDRPVPTHAEVVAAIASLDPDQAGGVMRRHILRTKELRLGVLTGEAA